MSQSGPQLDQRRLSGHFAPCNTPSPHTRAHTVTHTHKHTQAAPGLLSARAYLILGVASDLTGNVDPSIWHLPFTAPDVQPPVFLGEQTVTSPADTELSLTVTLDEAASVSFALLPAGSKVPSAAAVFNGGLGGGVCVCVFGRGRQLALLSASWPGGEYWVVVVNG